MRSDSMAMFIVFIASLGSLLAMIFGLQYVAMRVRNNSIQNPDPQLGRKFVMHMFATYAIFLLLIGMTMICWNVTDYLVEPAAQRQQQQWQQGPQRPIMFDDDDRFGPPQGRPIPGPAVRPGYVWDNSMNRTGFALILSGGLHWLVCWWVLWGTNTRKFPMVAREFAGMRLVICGLILMVVATGTIVAILQKDSTEIRLLQTAISLAIVFGPATLIQFFLVFVLGKHKDNPENRTALARVRQSPDEEGEHEGD